MYTATVNAAQESSQRLIANGVGKTQRKARRNCSIERVYEIHARYERMLKNKRDRENASAQAN